MRAPDRMIWRVEGGQFYSTMRRGVYQRAKRLMEQAINDEIGD